MTLITPFRVNWVDSSTCKGLNTLLGSRSALKNHILNVETRVLFLIRKPERAKKNVRNIYLAFRMRFFAETVSGRSGGCDRIFGELAGSRLFALYFTCTVVLPLRF